MEEWAELCSPDGNSVVRVAVSGYEYPEAEDEWDADWLWARFSLQVPGFDADLTATVFSAAELDVFYQELREFSALKRETAELVTMEPFVEMRLQFDSWKKVWVSGEVCNGEEDGLGELRFRFYTDLTYVDRWISGLARIRRRFPSKRNARHDRS